jgi:hypothetical protein
MGLVTALEATGLARPEAIAHALVAHGTDLPDLNEAWTASVAGNPGVGPLFAALGVVAAANPAKADALLGDWLERGRFKVWANGENLPALDFHTGTIVVMTLEDIPEEGPEKEALDALETRLGSAKDQSAYDFEPKQEAILRLVRDGDVWTDAATALEAQAEIHAQGWPLKAKVHRPNGLMNGEFLSAISALAKCDNCTAVFPPNPDIPDFSMRVDEDSVQPAGECPCCGALAYGFGSEDIPDLRSGPVPL